MGTEENAPARRLLEEFAASLQHLSPRTKRAYLAGARAVLKAASAAFEGHAAEPGADPWARARDLAASPGVRPQPFLRFLEARHGPAPAEGPEAARRQVLDALDRANRFQKNPSLAARRDAALVAALCAASDRGDPRAWPKGCLTRQGARLLLWDQEVPEPALGLALRHWLQWRERLERPDQRRLYRKGPEWARSGLLFPGPHGAPLARAAPHNALRRLLGRREGGFGLTPEKVRRAFRAVDPGAPVGGAG